jgi:hypothetical protein
MKTLQICDLGQATKVTIDRNTTVVESIRRQAQRQQTAAALWRRVFAILSR